MRMSSCAFNMKTEFLAFLHGTGVYHSALVYLQMVKTRKSLKILRSALQDFHRLESTKKPTVTASSTEAELLYLTATA